MPATKQTSYRFPERTLAIARAIAEPRGGLTITQVFIKAMDEHGKKVLGRRLADLVPVERREPGRD